MVMLNLKMAGTNSSAMDILNNTQFYLTTDYNFKEIIDELNDDMTGTLMPVIVFMGVETTFAFFGNLLVLYIFTFHYHNCNFRYFVLCLSLIDFTSSLTALPGEIVVALNWYMFPSDIYCKIKTFFNMYLVTSEALCLLTIAVDRYRKVCEPLGWQITLVMAKWLCIMDLLGGFFLSLPAAIYPANREKMKTYMNNTIPVTVCSIDKKYLSTPSLMAYDICNQTIMCILLASMIIMNILIYRRILKSTFRKTKQTMIDSDLSKKPDITTGGQSATEMSDVNITSSTDMADSSSTGADTAKSKHSKVLDAKRNSMAQRSKPDSDRARRARQKTKIIFVLTFIFSLTTILYLTLVHVKTTGKVDKMSDSEKTAFIFFFRMVTINHVINPFVYGCLDVNFRSAVSRLLRCNRN